MRAVDISLVFLLAHRYDCGSDSLLQLGRVVDAISTIRVMQDAVRWALVEVAFNQQAVYG
jgi:hypothetical protein